MKRVIILACLWAAGTAGAAEQLTLADRQYPYCQIVDRVLEPGADLSLGYAPEEKVADSTSKFGFVETIADLALGYYRTGAGDFDLSLHFRLWSEMGSNHYDLPDQFGFLRLKVQWDWRTQDGLTYRIAGYPGIYSALEDLAFDDLFVPFSLSGIQAFNERLSAQAGLSVYPGFDNVIDPIVGLRWAPADDWTFDLGYPETRGLWKALPGATLLAGYQVNRTWEFSLAESAPYNHFMYYDQRLYGGLDVEIADFTQLMFRGGWLFGRNLDFSSGIYRDSEIERGYFFSIGIGGLF